MLILERRLLTTIRSFRPSPGQIRRVQLADAVINRISLVSGKAGKAFVAVWPRAAMTEQQTSAGNMNLTRIIPPQRAISCGNWRVDSASCRQISSARGTDF